jgi:oligosaccharide reducing-end xylanase
MLELVQRVLAGVVALGVLSGCTATTDTLGADDAKTGAPTFEVQRLLPLAPPAYYENPFHDLLDNTSQEVTDRVNDAYNQLFLGNAENQAIYVAEGDTAYISDIYHDDIRTEGNGLGMMITVQLDHQVEFDKLWTYAKRVQRYASGPNAGYFQSRCDTSGASMPCVDPYGAEQFAMALIFAHNRWGSAGAIDYEADALDVLNAMRRRADTGDGPSEDATTNMFDTETHLPFDVPDVRINFASVTRPSVVMPAYYALWAQATGDPFWSSAADAARLMLNRAADDTTGFMPLRAYFDGTPVPGAELFTPEGYRVLLNLVLDQIWLRGNPTGVQTCEHVLKVFSALRDKGKSYVGAYKLDGTPDSITPEESLTPLNGATALIVKNGDRKDYIEAVWEMETPVEKNRYYTGILELFALLVLSGQMQVY